MQFADYVIMSLQASIPRLLRTFTSVVSVRVEEGAIPEESAGTMSRVDLVMLLSQASNTLRRAEVRSGNLPTVWSQ